MLITNLLVPPILNVEQIYFITKTESTWRECNKIGLLRILSKLVDGQLLESILRKRQLIPKRKFLLSAEYSIAE